MEREGAEPATKRSKPAYVRYVFNEKAGLILSLPPDIRRLMTSKRYLTPFDRLMVTMAHFDWDPEKTQLQELILAQEWAAKEGSYHQFAYFCKHLPLEHWRYVVLTLKTAEGGDVEKMKLIDKLDTSVTKSRLLDLEGVAALHAKPEMMRYLHGQNCSDPSYPYHYRTMVLAAAGGNMDIFNECLRNFDSENMAYDCGWEIYRQLIKHGHLHIIQWLELEELGEHVWDPECRWMWFNEIHVKRKGKAEEVAIKYGQTLVLDWVREQGLSYLKPLSILEIALHLSKSESIAFKSIDWILDHFSVVLDDGSLTLIPGALRESLFDVAKHLFRRGIPLSTYALLALPLPHQGNSHNIAKMVGELLRSVENAENEPEKYIVQRSGIGLDVDGDRRVMMRYPSSEHYQGK